MISKNDITEKAHEIFTLIKTLEKGRSTNPAETEKVIAFECGKLHLMAVLYAENDKHGLNAKGMENLKDFDYYDDPVAYVLALQVLIFKMLNLTKYDRETIIRIIKDRKIQHIEMWY